MRSLGNLVAGATLISVIGVPGPVFAADDPTAGLILAQRWCAGCHVVAPNGSGGDAGPAFMAVAKQPNLSPSSLRAWLTDPHPPMPNLSLSRKQIDDIIAYLDSLRTR